MRKTVCLLLTVMFTALLSGCALHKENGMPYGLPAYRGTEAAARIEDRVTIYAEEIERAWEERQEIDALNLEYIETSPDLTEDEKNLLFSQMQAPKSRQEILHDRIRQTVLLMEAEKRGIPDFKSEAEALYDDALAMMEEGTDDRGTMFAKTVFDSYVSRSGLTASEYREQIGVPVRQIECILSELERRFADEPDKKAVFGAETYEQYVDGLLSEYEIEVWISFEA